MPETDRHAPTREGTRRPLGDEYFPFTGPHATDPHPFFDRLREEEPVSFSPVLGMWLVSRYEDVCDVLRDPARFSNRDMLSSGAHLTDEAKAILARGYDTSHVLLGMDPPAHTRLRRLTNTGFTRRRIASMEPLVRRLATELVDAFAADGEADLVEQLAYPLPVRVILGVMGVPDEDVWRIKGWSADWQRLAFEPVPADEQPAMAEGVLAFQRYCIDLIDERRSRPQEDLTSYLVHAEHDGQRLTEHELVLAIGASMLSAGHESTTALMANTWKLALEHGVWERLRARREDVLPFLEESSRYDSVSHGMIRTPLEDVVVGGVEIPAGAPLMLLFASANRDEAACPHADRLDLDREGPRANLTFGRGTHFCLGAPLAKLQFEIVTNALLDRLPALRLVPGQDHGTWQSIVLRQMRHLRVTWDAG